MRILFQDLRRELKILGKEIEEAISKVISSGYYILGKKVEEFEGAFASWLGTRYAIGVGSGTEALHLSLVAIGIKPKDEVITATNTCGPTISAIMACQAIPVLVDVDPVSYCLNVGEVKKRITRRTRAIIPVHLYGQTADMDPLLEISRRFKIPIIEDCAQAHGAKYKDKKAGTLGLLGCFSFYPTKNLGTFGDAGMITTNNKELADKCRLLRNYGQRDRYRHDLAGFNSRLDELQAAILKVKLKRLDTWNLRRREIAKRYNSGINNPEVILPKEMDYNYHIYHLYVIRIKRSRKRFQEFLKKKGIFTLIHYPIPIHRQRFYRQIIGRNNHYPVAEELAKQIVSLPMYPFLEDEEIDYIIDVINDYQN